MPQTNDIVLPGFVGDDFGRVGAVSCPNADLLCEKLDAVEIHFDGRHVKPGILCQVAEYAGRRSNFGFCSRWGLPCRCRCRSARCALTAPFHPYRDRYATRPRRSVFCGTVPEADSACAKPSPPDVIRHRSSMEPGLSSPAAFRHWHGAAVQPTDAARNGARGSRSQAFDGLQVKKKPGPAGRGRRPGRGSREVAGRRIRRGRGSGGPTGNV